MEKAEKIKVLYVDDEINNLIGLKATFRLDYNVITATSAAEATGLLDKHPDIKVILCDQRMPDKTGVQFFQEISGRHPAPVRMLLTGYTDIESVIQAINQGNIYRYITKPWQETDIRSAIEEGYKYYVTTSMLKIKNEELQNAYNELDKFAYSVTHDMRGPILSVKGAIELAKNAPDMNETRAILDMMEKSIDGVDSFIRNVHEYYNLKRGELQITDIRFEDLIAGIRDLYDIGAKVDNIRFEVRIDQTENFRCDLVSLKIILNNLLSNAFKYQIKENKDKFVGLEIGVNRGEASIFVKDNGIGIDEAYIKDIFNMFYRATSENIGSGFGLYNVKDALRKINGEIRVTSRLGEGTSFNVSIPSK